MENILVLDFVKNEDVGIQMENVISFSVQICPYLSVGWYRGEIQTIAHTMQNQISYVQLYLLKKERLYRPQNLSDFTRLNHPGHTLIGLLTVESVTAAAESVILFVSRLLGAPS